MTEEIIKEGDSVILYFSITNILLIPSILPDGTTHNGCGFFNHSDIIGKPFGSKVHPRMNSEIPRPVHVLRVTPELFTLSIPHRTQIIYHADISAIMMGLDILPGSYIAEAGTGSASLSFSFAHTIAPSGRLFTFEIDPSRAEHNRDLLRKVTDDGVVTLEERDVITAGFPENLLVDAVFLDLPSPWLAISNAHKILKENGRLCTFSPSIEQVSKNVKALQENGFHEIRTIEVMLKPWGLDLPKEAGEKRKRDGEHGKSFQLPMRGHTSYLTFAIKELLDEKKFPKPVLNLAKVRNMIEAKLQ
jgi:tRNA (adenine57-N1/adenine58-N1)-methyltransferase